MNQIFVTSRLIALIVFTSVATPSFSQQCGYDNYYLFVVNTHLKNDLQTIPGLKMYLVDENEQPIRVSVSYEENNQWNTRSESLFFWDDKSIGYAKYSPKACISFSEKFHTLPLKSVIGANSTTFIKDTFWLYNGCDDAVFINKVESPFKDFFSISTTLLPKGKTPLIFNGVLRNSDSDFNTNYYYCIITLADSTMLIFHVAVPVVSDNLSVIYNKDSTINHAIGKQENKRFTTAVLAYPNGNLRAVGLVLDRDTTLKVGVWQYYQDGGGVIGGAVYSKAISLSAFQESNGGQHTNFNIKVLENGTWKRPITELNNYALRFYISPKTDSIVAYTDTSSYPFAVSYEEFLPQFSKQFFLLKPNQRSLKIGYYTMPFNTIEDSYSLIPNYALFKNPNQTTFQITDSIISSLQKKYPKLTLVYVSRRHRGISLTQLSKEEKKQLLLELEQDSTIQFVCKHFSLNNRQHFGYCNNLVPIEVNTGNIDSIRKSVLDIGFTNISTESVYNRFLLTYKSKILDEDFFDAFKKLTEHKFVVGAFFNTYIDAEPDLDFDRPYKH